MAKSKLTFTFLRDAVDTEQVTFLLRKIDNPSVFVVYVMKWATPNPRVASYRIPVDITLTPPWNDVAAQTAFLYFFYLKLDFPNIPATISQGVDENIIVIEATDEIWEFHAITHSAGLVSYLVENGTGPTFTLDNLVFASATDICNQVRLNFTTGELATKITVNGLVTTTTNVNNPVDVDVTRGIPINIILENANGDKIFYPDGPYLVFSRYQTSDIDVVVNSNITSSTVIVNINETSYINTDGNLTFEYSLNDVDWQTSNVFTGQAPGNYTMYVRDQYGCKKQKDYTVTSVGTRDPFLFISKANSISFAECEVWDNCLIFKNDENILSHQNLTSIKFCDPILYNKCDKPTIQFKSNYDTVSAVLRKEDETEVSLAISKRSANLGRFQRMDAFYYNYKDGYTGIFFESGDTYDNLNAKNGEYSLNGNLPDFAIKGQFIIIDILGTFEIEDIVFDSEKNKRAIIIKNSYTGADTLTRVESTYDILPYEIYEFDIDFTTLALDTGFYDILITNTDTTNGTVQHLSENIYLEDEHPDSLHIRYFNDNNRDIFYKYGIQHTLRASYTHIKASMIDEVEITRGDLTSALTVSKVYEVNEFVFPDLTNPAMRKLSIALSCQYVFINGAGYIKNDSLEIENIPNTNLHNLTALMLKTNINYNNNRQGQTGVDIGGLDFNIPAFVIGETGFIKN